MRLYQITAKMPSPDTIRFPERESIRSPLMKSRNAAYSAFRGPIFPEGIGLDRVLSIRASLSLSWNWFRPQAPHARKKTPAVELNVPDDMDEVTSMLPVAVDKAANNAILILQSSRYDCNI